MSDLINRETLEELFLSLILQANNDDDISTINLIYKRYKERQYIFPLSNTELYFKQFIISYCKKYREEIEKKITDISIKEEFNNNFMEKIEIKKEINLEQANYNTFDERVDNNILQNIDNNIKESLINENEVDRPWYRRYRIPLIIVVILIILLIVILSIYFTRTKSKK